MHTKSSFFPFAIAAILVSIQAAATPMTKVVTGFANPESVLIDGPRRFVSNIGEQLDPLGHDGDGFISELDADGRIVALHAFPTGEGKLDAPKGMAILSGTLYVADIDRIVGFDLATREQVFETRVPAGGSTLLNDLAVMEGGLVVSDTLRGNIYRVDVGAGTFTTIAEGIPGANGLVWDTAKKRVLVVGLGAKFEGGDLYEISAEGQVRKIEWGPHGILDGLALLPDGRMIISDWRSIDPPAPGAITLYAADGSASEPLDLGREIHGPADFTVDVSRWEIWLPATVDGAILIAPLKH